MYPTVFLKNKLIYACLMLVLLSCNRKEETSLPYYNTPDFTPIFITNVKEISKKIPHKIGHFSCTDQNGKIITDATIEGKIHIANFFFTSCNSICPSMTNHLKKASAIFKNDSSIIFLSYSVTPWIDSIPKLKAYKENNEISNKNWHFLTGNKVAIYQLARTSYFAEEDLGFSKDSTDFLHTEHILLVDKTKRIRGIYNGTLQLDIEQLIADIQQLKKEEQNQ